jgi:hypothetical protein
MSHANANLTPRQRLRVARLGIDHCWQVSRAAEQFNSSWLTAKRWAERYAVMGESGMTDRSSRPNRVANRTPQNEAGHVGIDGPDPVPPEPSTPRGQTYRWGHPPVRARQARGDAPRRCEEAQQHPERGRLARTLADGWAFQRF